MTDRWRALAEAQMPSLQPSAWETDRQRIDGWQLSNWIHEAGLSLDPAADQELRKTQTMQEALRIAEAGGLDMAALTQVEQWHQVEAQVKEEAESGVAVAPFDSGEVEAVTPDVVQPTVVTTEAGQTIFDASELGTDADRIIAAIIANREGPEAQASAIQFIYGGIDPIEHLAYVSGDDYSPWGDVSRFERIDRLQEGFRLRAFDETEETIESEWWVNQYQAQAYKQGENVFQWASASASQRARWEEKMVRAGLLEEDMFNAGQMGLAQMNAMEVANKVGNTIGFGFELALDMMGDEKEKIDAANARKPGGGGRAPFRPPTIQVPDYESISQETQNMFRQRLGRDAEEYELAILADEMQKHYKANATDQVAAARSSYYGKGGTMEVANPGLRTQRFIEDRYSSEIGRYEDMEDMRATNNHIINAITKGTSMVDTI